MLVAGEDEGIGMFRQLLDRVGEWGYTGSGEAIGTVVGSKAEERDTVELFVVEIGQACIQDTGVADMSQ
jgi:hypothetical protein